MKIDSQPQNNIENKDVNIQETQEEKEILTPVNLPFSQLLNPELFRINSENSELSMLPVDYNFDSVNLNIDDAMFFVDLTKEAQFSIEVSENGEFKTLAKLEVAQTEVAKKTVEVTNKISELIQKAQSTQKPVRITFDNNVSVIIKIDKKGKVSAEFIPGSLEVENYLKNNINSLKQRFDEQNLPYNDLLYRQNNRQNNKQNGKQNKNKGE